MSDIWNCPLNAVFPFKTQVRNGYKALMSVTRIKISTSTFVIQWRTYTLWKTSMYPKLTNGNDWHLRISQDIDPIDLLQPFDDLPRGVNDLLRALDVSVAAVVHQGGPAGGDDAAGAGTAYSDGWFVVPKYDENCAKVFACLSFTITKYGNNGMSIR